MMRDASDNFERVQALKAELKPEAEMTARQVLAPADLAKPIGPSRPGRNVFKGLKAVFRQLRLESGIFFAKRSMPNNPMDLRRIGKILPSESDNG
ncbi:MAG: hypothetical protein CVV06_01975 [Gammaproteobacteria bacterium HGW-Gammaproteobacteria-10]|nr:MAG: hypothetical protein CVV06_01975 [Gammaproteobacteria bacterium HGW-Gammaproteobacteria-10]